MPLILNKVLAGAARVKGEGGPQIVVEMEYLPELSSNRRLTKNRVTGATVLRSSVRSWMDQLAWMVKIMKDSAKMEFELPVKVALDAEFSTRRVPDTHNLIKSICDAIEMGLGINDKHFTIDCSAAKVVPKHRDFTPKLVITIGEPAAGEVKMELRKGGK